MKKKTEFGEMLSSAIEKSSSKIENFVWKKSDGSTVKLVDMSIDDLTKAYNHADSMLHSENAYHPGKYVVRKNIQNMYANCNAELLLRYILYVSNIEQLKTKKDIVDVINEYRNVLHIKDNDYVTVIFDNLPTAFEKVTIEKLVRACLDSLEPFNRRLISNDFIIGRGLWLTEKEKQDLIEYDEHGNKKNRLEVIKERLFLGNVHLRIDQRGLTYNEFRSLVQLSPRIKFSAIPTATLELLRDKILLMLDNELNYHIQKWTSIQENIKKVLDFKNSENENQK